MPAHRLVRAAAVALSAALIARPAAALPPNAASPVRDVARYEIKSGHRDRAMRITVADSAGTLVARYRMAGERAEHPMVVTAEGADLLLSAVGERGPVQLLLRGQNGAQRQRTFTAEWLIGEEQGTFTGTVR